MIQEKSVYRRLVRGLALNPALLLAVLLFFRQLGEHGTGTEFPFPTDLVLEISGRVSTPPQIGEGFAYFEMSTPLLVSVPGRETLRWFEEGIAVYLDLSAEVPVELPAWGTRIRFRSYLREPVYFAVPGVADARVRLRARGILAIAKLKSPRQIEILRGPPFWKRLLSRYRRGFQLFAEDHLSVPVRVLSAAGFLGNRREMPVALRESLRNTGLVHLFSVSGFHVTLILVATHWLCRFMGRWVHPLSLLVMWGYVLTIGVPLTALRAAFMNSLGYVCWLLGSRQAYFNGLGLVALLLLWTWPGAADHPGFHFSFLALLSIGIYFRLAFPQVRALRRAVENLWETSILPDPHSVSRFERRIRFGLEQYLIRGQPFLRRPHRIRIMALLGPVIHWALLALHIQVLTLPLAVHYSNRIAWIQLPANLLLNPLFSLFLLLCLLAFAFYWTPPAALLGLLMEGVGRLWLWELQWLSAPDWVSWIPHPSGRETLLWTAFVFALVWVWGRTFWTLPATLLLLLGLSLRSGGEGNGSLRLTLLDVGQGDGLHLEYPDGTQALVDTGGLVFSEDVDFLARHVVARYLWHRSVTSLAFVLLTHKDLDHAQGASFLQKAFSPKFFLVGSGHPEALLPERASLRRLEAGDRFEVGGVRHRVLNPPAGTAVPRAGNEESVVVELEWRRFRLLLTGDIGIPTERRLLRDARLQTAMKAPHHGSRGANSLEFIAAFRPRIAIVSAGRRNPFGHPSPEVISKYHDSSVPVYGTQEWGSLRIETDGATWTLSHFSTKTRRFEVLLDGDVREAD